MLKTIISAGLLAVLCASSLFAAPCGSYFEEKTGSRLEFGDDGVVNEYGANGIMASANNYFRSGTVINLRNAENGLAAGYRLSPDGMQLLLPDNTWGDRLFAARQPYACPVKPGLQYLAGPVCEPGMDSGCCAAGDAGACVQDAGGKEDKAVLQQFCISRPDACLLLSGIYQRQANPQRGLFNMYAEKQPLPREQLQELAAACTRHRTPELCRKSMEQLWLATRFGEARELLDTMCSAKLDAHACARSSQLRSLALPRSVVPAVSIPCGTYKSTVSSLTGDVSFGDRGVVEFGGGSRIRARLEDGRVKIRHDKGGDFVFVRSGEDLLFGLDEWNMPEVYLRTALPGKGCQALPVFDEQPLSEGCGLDKDPKQCCLAGDSQGCNRLGNMAALGNRWGEAAEMYAKVCGQGVRVGCENWIYTVGKTGDDKSVEEGLARLCSRDKRHVACDLLEVNRIPMLLLSHGMEQAMKEAGLPEK